MTFICYYSCGIWSLSVAVECLNRHVPVLGFRGCKSKFKNFFPVKTTTSWGLGHFLNISCQFLLIHWKEAPTIFPVWWSGESLFNNGCSCKKLVRRILRSKLVADQLSRERMWCLHVLLLWSSPVRFHIYLSFKCSLIVRRSPAHWLSDAIDQYHVGFLKRQIRQK